MNVPFINLSKQFIDLEGELVEAFKTVGRSGNYIMGDRLKSFEDNIAQYCETKYAIGVGSGSDALFLILKALNIGIGDEIIIPTNSFIATGWVVAATGAKPVFVDVCDDLNIDVNLTTKAITKNTKAIIPVHLTGRPSEMDKLNQIGKKFNVAIVEDAAQAIGARYKKKKVGSLGCAAAFSLHPLKNLGVYGDGGFITTDNEQIKTEIIPDINNKFDELFLYNLSSVGISFLLIVSAIIGFNIWKSALDGASIIAAIKIATL